MKKYKIVELFAGVGGFRLGLEKYGHKTVWANQWEPKTKTVQYAYDCYISNFGDFEGLNTDIGKIDEAMIKPHDLIVGGFPCQDYSVATVSAKGMEGKKGVLWWDINRIISEKNPELILLENVDRLLKSPVPQRGRDFGVMLACLANNDYVVEWRVINAGEYGFPQKRRRVFIFGAKKDSLWGKHIIKTAQSNSILNKGFFAKEFPVKDNSDLSLFNDPITGILPKNIKKVSDEFELPFQNSGFMINRNISTIKVEAVKSKMVTLRDILIKGVDKKYYIPKEDIEKWKYLKGGKKKIKVKNGVEIKWSEGAVPFPEDLKQPARTILTGEGGLAPSRFKHLIEDPWTKKLRVITPEEAELISGFPKGHTASIPVEKWRYFCIGNALVVGLVEKMGKQLRDGPPK